jgi:predicted MFS family arabinose efflux permease
MVASWAATVSLSVVAYDRGGSPAVAAAVLARTVPGLALGSILGVVVDRVSKARALAGSALVSALAAACAVLVSHQLVAVITLVTIIAMATMVFRAAQSAVLPELVESPTELTEANVLASAVEAVGVLVGPALAGALLATQGPALAFGVAAALFLVAGLLALRSSHGEASAPDEAGAPTSTGFVDVLRVPAARLLLGLLLVQTFVSGGLVVLYAAVAVDVVEAGLSAVGLLTAAFGLGGVVGSIGLFALAGSRRLGILSAVALMLWAAPLLLVPVLPHLVLVLVLLVLTGIGNVLFDVTSVTLLQRAVPAHLLGRAFGAVETVVVAGLGAGAAAAPLLDRVVGAGAAIAVLAVPLAVCALIAVPSLRTLDRQLHAPVREIELLRGLAPFALLPTVELEALALRLRRLEVAAGAVVVRQGDSGTLYYVVDEGTLDVAVDARVVGTLTAGEGFGEVALLRGGVRTATVTARSDAVVWALDGGVFLSALSGRGRSLAAAHAVAEARLGRAAPRQG